jgi:hypothetical protein
VFGRSSALLLILWSSVAAASPRVVVADADDDLRAAIAESLRPWHIDVVDTADPPTDRDAAADDARSADAGYVIWREGADLVVYDREHDRLEHRPGRAGALDRVAAAGIALSVKTILRLPPLEDHPPIVAAVVVPPAVEDPLELRFTASSGSRFEYGYDGNIALRFGAAIAVRPWHDREWRFAVIGDVGAPATVDQAGFHGEWWNWGALVGASWDHRIGDWELGPRLALGIEHSSLDGTQKGMTRREESLLPALRGGLAVRRLFGALSIGGELSLETLLGRDTYTAPNGMAQVFEIPPIGAVLSLVIGADIAP